MIPTFDSKVTSVKSVIQPGKTYRWNRETKRIGGITDGLEAIVQAASKSLMTVRYSSLIYSGNYGHELNDLIGTDKSFAEAELKRVIEDTLKVDDRITSVHTFIITEVNGNAFNVQFILGTVEGEATLEIGVQI